MIRNKRLLFCVFLVLSFILGFSFDRVDIFQYKKIVKLKDYIFKINSFNEINTDFRSIRNKYPNYNSLNLDYKEIFIKKYKLGTNIFSNRTYRNILNEEFLDSLYVIKIPAHYYQDIKLVVLKKLKVYRAICRKNNNNHLDDWSKEKQEILIIGHRCIHQKLVSKNLNIGTHYIKSGGPFASDPIFIEQDDYKDIYFKVPSN